jgi:hypothetical protein
VTRGRGRGETRLTVGEVGGTSAYPRTAQFLLFGGRLDSEGVSLARIHIQQCLNGFRRGCGLCGLLPEASLQRTLVCDAAGVWRGCVLCGLLPVASLGRALAWGFCGLRG